jgi:hypothetical protein
MTDPWARPCRRSRLGLNFCLLTLTLLVAPAACSSGSFSSGNGAGTAGTDDSASQAGDGTAVHGGSSTGGSASGGKASGGSETGGSANAGSVSGGEPAANGGEASGSGEGGADGAPVVCAEACKDPTPYCAEVNGTPTCTNPVQALSGKRIELPCVAGADAVSQLCQTVEDRATQCPVGGKLTKQTIQMSGDPNTLYSVTLRIRGVVEPRTYVGGKDAGNHFYVGGTGQQPSNYNTYGIVVSSPAQTFWLNSDTKAESYRVFTLDHQKAIVVEGGASITLQVFDPDCAMVKNCQSAEADVCMPYVVAGVPPAPSAYNGQFVQLDVVGVSPAN